MAVAFTACLAALLAVLVALYGDPNDLLRPEQEQRPDMLPPAAPDEDQGAEEQIEHD